MDVGWGGLKEIYIKIDIFSGKTLTCIFCIISFSLSANFAKIILKVTFQIIIKFI